ncbi:type I polyketide synthase, partial [Streptomyces sp. NBC_01275]|uniref:type I polyketide synthase n=1 Tax=Streptomyces sp. NBC_01275 TaxID=2903807 RepID=UPI0022585F1A
VMPTPDIFIGFRRMGALSATSRCKAFSDDADGFGLAEGAGVLLLERLSDARRNGHPVLAVVRGSALNQDGASNGLTAPNGPSQQRVIRAALADAGLAPAEVDAVEAHGTGTRLGDPIEAQALIAAYGQDRSAERPLRLGSLKSNIGHTQAAAGVAGVMKMVLAMRHGILPKTLHVTEPTTHVDWSSGTVELLTEPHEWSAGERPRRAGVSAFGISGTNAHVILEQAPQEARLDATPEAEPGRPTVAWPVSARSAEALRAQAGQLRDTVSKHPEWTPAQVAHALATGRADFEHRAVLVGTEREQLLCGLRALATGADDATGVVTGHGDAGRPVFVFPGQGSQWTGMAVELLDTSAVFAQSIADCEAALAPHVDWSLTEQLRNGEPLTRVDVVQPALFAVMVSLAAVWRSLGVEPAAVVGHSQGEIAAAVVAGALTLEDGAKIAALRSRAILELAGHGGMISLPLSSEDTAELLEEWPGRVSIAALNGPHTTVVAGDATALDELLAHCEAEGVHARRIDVDYASHTHHVEALQDDLAELLTGITPRTSTVSFYSTVTGTTLDTRELTGAYWYTNLRRPVLLEPTLRLLTADGHNAYVECSPHPVLVPAIEEATGGSGTGTLRRDEGGWQRLLTSAAHLHTHGTPVTWPTSPAAHPLDLPTYPFQRKPYWLDATSPAHSAEPAGHPLLDASIPLAGSDGLILTGRLSTRTHPWLADHTVWNTVLVPGTGLVELALQAADRAGCDVLEELTLHAPLVLPENNAVRLQVSVDAPDETGRRTVSIHTRPEQTSDDAPWIHHATGYVTTGAPRPDWDLTAWPPAGAHPVDLTGLYSRLAEQGLGYGPAFQGLHAVWRRGEELFAEVRLAPGEQDTADRYGLHPALLDAALHTSLVDGIDDDFDDVRLPFAWNGVTLHATGATALRVHLTPQGPEALTLTVADQDGVPVATVSSLAVRPVTREQLAAASRAATAADALFEVTWTPVPPGAGTTPVVRAAVVGPDPLGLGTALGTPVAAGFGALTGAPPEVVVLPWARPDEASPTGEAAGASVFRALESLREWLADDRFAESRLVLVTRGAVAVEDGENVSDLASAAVRGLVRSAQAEHPGRVVVADVDEPDAVRTLVAAVGPGDGGEEQYAVRGGRLLVPRLTRPRAASASQAASAGRAAPWDPEGTVLITGGTGTLGSLVARHLVAQHGVRHLQLLSRQGVNAPGADRLRADLEDLGASVAVTACDVSDPASLAEALAGIPGDRPLTAVVHTAGALDDATLDTLTPHHISTVMRPKADAAWHLHHLTRDRRHPLKAFVLFSAAGGLLGTAGQGNYAAANAYLDALAAHRRALGLPAVSLAWGLWEEASGLTGGLTPADLARMRRAGVLPLSTEDGLALFDRALGQERALVVPVRLDLPALRGEAGNRPLLRELAPRAELPRAAAGTAEAPADAGAGTARPGLSLAGLTAGERAHVLEELVRTKVATVLGHASADAVEPERGFLDAGFDSLRAVELRNLLNTATGLRLPATLVFDHPTSTAVAAHLDELLSAAEDTKNAESAESAESADGTQDSEQPTHAGLEAASGLEAVDALETVDALEAGLLASGLLADAVGGDSAADRERVATRLRGLLDRLAPSGALREESAVVATDRRQDGFGGFESEFDDVSLDDILTIVDDELRKS